MTTIDFNPAAFTEGSALPAAEQRARNTSTASENKIHDDAVARQYGFRGGLVPGATSYAYLASHLTRLLGPAWAAYGTSSIALVKPVYEGEMVSLGGQVLHITGDANRGALDLACWVDGADGVRRAPGTAGLTWGESRTQESRPAFAVTELEPRRPEDRLPISAATAPVGEPLPPVLIDTSSAAAAAYLDGIDDHNPLFRDGSTFGGPLLHPGWYLGIANQALSRNFILNAWIHTRSETRHLGPALAGGTYRAYAQITAAFEKRGHEYVTADVLIAGSADQPIARITHTAIVVVARKG